MSKFRIAVFGDRMEDVYYIGEANSLSAEVPIPVVKVREIKGFPGGAGNVVKNLQSLGCEVVDYSINHDMPAYPGKNRLMVGDHQVARWDVNDYCTPYRGKVFQKVDAIIVADYGKGAIDKDIIEKIKLMDAPIFVDTKNDPSVWSGVATAVFPNKKEYNQHKRAYELFRGLIVLKDGAKGLAIRTCVDTGIGVWLTSSAQARFVRSVNGAGDTVIANFVLAWLSFEGKNYEGMLKWCNAAAAIAVEHPYTYAPTLEEINMRFCENR